MSEMNTELIPTTNSPPTLDEGCLHNYQQYCVDFLEEHPQCALFLDCGLGKTIITLTAIQHLMYDSFDVNRVLIIAPLRVARDTWIAELSKWRHLKGLRMQRVIGSEKDRVLALGERADVYVINRENTEWLVKHYSGRKLPFDMLVLDELSSFKNYRSKRFMALKKVIGQFGRVIGLTGTPAPNSLEELWPQVFLLDRGVRLGRTMRTYIDLYFTTPNSWLPYKHELKEGAEDAIYKKLSDICVSMKATDHLKMPEKVDNIVEVTLSTKEMKLYRQMERDMLLPYPCAEINPLGDWKGGTNVDTGATNRKLGSDMGDSITGGGLHGKDLSKADVSVNIYAWMKAQATGESVEISCAIGDRIVDGIPFGAIVELARAFIHELGGFEKFAEWGLIR